MKGSWLFDDTDWKSKKVITSADNLFFPLKFGKEQKRFARSHVSCFPLKIMLLMLGQGGRLLKKEMGSSLFVTTPLIFSEALGFSLLSL